MHSNAAAVAAACANCGAAMHGPYCSDCGQKHQPHDPSLHDLWHEIVHEFLHLDGKIFVTLKTLFFRPGELTAERLAGRRTRFIGALRLYLTFSVLYFVIAGLVPKVDGGNNTGVSVKTVESKPGERHTKAYTFWMDRARHLQEKLKENPAEVRHAFQAGLSKALFVLLPLFAACLRLVYRKSGRHYPAFLYFSLDYHSFAFAALSVDRLANLTRSRAVTDATSALFLVGVLVYLAIALRRLFGGAIGRTIWRVALVACMYVPLFLLGVVGAAIGTMLLV